MSLLALRWVAARARIRSGPFRLGDHAVAEVCSHVEACEAGRGSFDGWWRRRIRAFTSLMAAIWGNSVLNQLADRAGRHRRLAVAAGLAAWPVAVVGMVATTAGRPMWAEPRFAGLVALAVCLLWLTVDLLRTGSLASQGRRPHLSTMGLVGSILLIGAGRIALDGGELSAAAYTGIALSTIALLSLTVADVRPNLVIDLAGRVLLVGAALSLASAIVEWLASAADQRHAATAGLALVVCVLTYLGVAEARMVARRLRLIARLL